MQLLPLVLKGTSQHLNDFLNLKLPLRGKLVAQNSSHFRELQTWSVKPTAAPGEKHCSHCTVWKEENTFRLITSATCTFQHLPNAFQIVYVEDEGNSLEKGKDLETELTPVQSEPGISPAQAGIKGSHYQRRRSAERQSTNPPGLVRSQLVSQGKSKYFYDVKASAGIKGFKLPPFSNHLCVVFHCFCFYAKCLKLCHVTCCITVFPCVPLLLMKDPWRNMSFKIYI